MLDRNYLYYPDEECQILPFIIAPIGEYQDTLILAPQSISKIHDQFIRIIYSPIANENIESIYSRAFNYKSSLCITISFPTKVKDEANRLGMIFTIGCLINQNVFSNHHSVSRTYINLMILLINNLFNINLLNDGANSLLTILEGEINIRKHLLIIKDVLLISSFAIKKTKTSIFKFSLKKEKRTIPKAILYPPSLELKKYIDLFLNEIDSIFEESYNQKLDINTNGKKVTDFISLIPIKNIPVEITSAKIKKIEKEKYICLY